VIYGTYSNDCNNYYTFSLSSKTTIDLKTVWYTSNVDVMQIYLYNQSGAELYTDTTSQGNALGKVTDHFYITLDAGEYYLLLQYNYNTISSVKYDLQVTEYQTKDLYNCGGKDINSARTILLGQTAKAIIYGGYVEDYCRDYYTFTLSQKQNISIEAKFDTDGQPYTLIDIYDSENNSVYSYQGYINEYQNVISLPAGKYYICIDLSSNNGNGGQWCDLRISKQVQKTQKITVSKKASKTIIYNTKTLKKKKATFSISAKARGSISYKVTIGNSKYISVSKSGRVTLKKGCKKGTYKITVTAKATSEYKKATKIVTIKVK
jgi:hypothetical protein